MTEKILPQPADSASRPQVSREREVEIYRVFTEMGIHGQPSTGGRYPRFKKLGFLAPPPYGVEVSGNSGS